MRARLFTNLSGTICDRCDYLVDKYRTMPWGDTVAKVCNECYQFVMEDN